MEHGASAVCAPGRDHNVVDLADLVVAGADDVRADEIGEPLLTWRGGRRGASLSGATGSGRLRRAAAIGRVAIRAGGGSVRLDGRGGRELLACTRSRSRGPRGA